MTFLRLGMRIGGISIIKGEDSHGISLLKIKPEVRVRAKTTPNTTRKAAKETCARITRIILNLAEQGTPSDSRKMAINRSLLLSSTLVEIVAMVTQEKPSTIGSTALPLSPIFLKSLSSRMESREKYPESSINPKVKKKTTMTGSTRPKAGISAMV